MSIHLVHALQRVRIFRPDGSLLPRRSLASILGTLRVLADRANDAHLHAPVRLYVEEVARLATRGVRATQASLQAAVAAGLIWRTRDTGAIGLQSAWAVLFHPALVQAAEGTKSYLGPSLDFPRPWGNGAADDDQVSVLLLHGVHPTTQLHEVHSVQGKRVTIHAPPPGVRGAAVDGGRPPSPARRNVQGVSPATRRGAGGRGAGQGLTDLADGNQSTAPSAPDTYDIDSTGGGPNLYWRCLAASAEIAGWSGQVAFRGQRRRLDGLRGGDFSLATSALTEAPQAAIRALAIAADRSQTQTKVEVSWRVSHEVHPFLLVDDLQAATLARLPSAGCAILETSPGNFQATLVAPRALSGGERLVAQRALARRFGGDEGAVSRSQLRRCPGSRNHKPELTAPFCARVHACSAAGVLDRLLLAELLTEGVAAGGTDPTGEVPPIVPRDGDASRADFGFCMAQLTRHGGLAGRALVEAVVARRVSRAGDKYSDDHAKATAYAVRTVSAAEVRAVRRP